MKIRIPSSLRRLTGSAGIIEESAATVAGLIGRLDERFPGFKDRLCEPDGQLRRFIRVFVNGHDVRDLQGIETALADADEVVITAAMAGGA